MLDSWFGPSEEVAQALMNADADKQDDKWLFRGPSPILGLGACEVIVPVETEVRVKNEWVKLVSLLPRGVRVMVIS